MLSIRNSFILSRKTQIFLNVHEWKGFWEDGKIDSTSNPPSQTRNTQAESLWCHYFGTPQSIEDLQLPVGRLSQVSCNWFWSWHAVVNFSPQHSGNYSSLIPQRHSNQLGRCPWNSLYTAGPCEQKGCYLPNTCVVWSDCCFCSQKSR